MKKFILPLIICFALVLNTACAQSPNLAEPFTVTCGEEQFVHRDMRELQDRIAQMEDRMDAAHRMAEAARELDFSKTAAIVAFAKDEYEEAKNKKEAYQTAYDTLEAHWHEKELEYPYATYVWQFLEDRGYNDAVIAGIIGNMMAECGGHTLALEWWIQGSYYGICQWSHGYPSVWGASLEGQCNFLEDTIKYELDTYGYMYKKGFNYEEKLMISYDDKVIVDGFHTDKNIIELTFEKEELINVKRID